MDRKSREKQLHTILAHEYDERREGTKTGRYYSKEWLRVMVRRLPKLDGKFSILDIGCGTGILYEVLKEENLDFEYTGIDLSESMVEVGRKRYPGIDLKVMDSENLDFPEKTFDFVFMRSVLHHLPNPAAAIREMNRVGKGTIIISEPLRNILTELPRYLLKKLTTHFDEEHTHFSKKEMDYFFKESKTGKYKSYHFGYLAYPFGFTDILPFTRYLPLFIMKMLFAIDSVISKIPLINYFSWHMIYVSQK